MTKLKPIAGTDFFLWKYLPSLILSVIALALFTIVTVAHFWRMVRFRSWYWVAFLLGGFFQMAGYAVRILSRYYTDQIAPYTVQSCLILLAPVFYTASIYMLLGRLITSLDGDRFSLIRPTRMTKLFVAGDILALNVQGNGAGLAAKKKFHKLGEYIVIVGLAVQLVIFGIFVVATWVFHTKICKQLRAKRVEFSNASQAEVDVESSARSRSKVLLRNGLIVLYLCSALITIRSLFRLVEYVMGTDSYLLTTEWPMYAFDATLMLAVQVIFFGFCPGTLQLQRDGKADNGIGLVTKGNPAM